MQRLLDNLKQSRPALRYKEIRHRCTYEKKEKLMAKGMERFSRCQTRKPARQIKKEMKRCQQYWGCYPLHYYRYDLYREDKRLTEQELINYIPEFFFYELFLPYYDSDTYRILLCNKTITEQYFRSLDIAQAHTICTLNRGSLHTKELSEITFSAVKQELADKKYKKLFCKPVDGMGGYGIYIFSRDEQGRFVTGDAEMFDEDFLKRIGSANDYIIQAGIEQDEQITKIYPHSVNTFRIATENLNGTARLLCATLRMGRAGMQVDNGSQEGLLIKVDMASGQLCGYATTEMGGCFASHPDTGFVFDGFQIAAWDSIKKFVVASAKKLAYFTYIGWDIALSSDGPLAIEANQGFGLDHYQVTFGGLREIFHIDEPGLYWSNRNKRT